ncbi:uncharacterized protein LOC121380178 [Gigantopelta aegis]|uniref:uncharacterized protein LOC121380178 n=1 Tax=Gigantopelta aegis TaxID=1735272 RepID=UPI001B88AF96|nr:uncharacterized protein LOC121380178 [Gigantopelta aegis]
MMKPLISLTDVTFVEAVTEIHVIYWMHESYLMSSLNLMDACLQVIDISFEAMLKACFSKDDEKDGCETDSEYGADKAEKHIEDDANKDGNHGNTEESSVTKHRLVNYCCKLLIPSQKVSSTFCVDKWLRSVSLVLSLSSEISLEPKIIQHLRICSDFATLIIIPYSLPSDTLLELGENILMQGLGSEDLLCCIFSLLCDLRQKLVNAEKDLQHFLTCYLSSCLSADPNSQILAWTFKELKTKLFESNFYFFGPTLHQALAMEVSTGLDILNDNQCDNNEFIQILNDFLDADSETQEGASVLAALIIDVLHHFILNEIDLFDGSDENNCAVVKEMFRCQEIISVEDKLNFKRLAAIAFLKSVITSLSCVIKSKNVGFKQTSYWQQMCNIFHLCHNGHEGCNKNRAIESMQKMLLQTLVEGGGLKGFDEVRQACTDMPEFLHVIDIDLEHRIQTVEHNPWAQHDEKEKVAFYSLRSSTTDMCSLMECVDENPEVLMKMCSFVIQQQFLKQIVSPLTGTEKSISESFIQCAKDCSISQQIIHLFECLCASKDFDFPLLHISSSTDNENFSMVSVLVHLFSIITVQEASGTTSVLSRCLVNPVELDLVYIYSCPDEGAAETLGALKLESVDMVTFINCSCTFVTAIKDNRGKQNTKCSVCQYQFPDGHKKSKKISIQDTHDARHGYTCFENDFVKNPLNSIRRLSPVAFRLLQFLIHGSFVGSLALQNSTIDDLATVLKLNDGAQVINHLTEQLQIHWKALKTLTFFGDAQLCKFLHHVLDDQKRLLFENPSAFLNKQEREDFEREFDENVVVLMKDRFDLVQKIVITNSETVGDNPAVEFEKTLNEIPDDHGDSKHLTRLFRITIPPTMENMEIEFLNAKMGSSFPILGLVFEKKVMLDMLSHLLPLVQWHLCTVRYLRNRIKKAECNKTALETFIYNLEQSGNKDSEKALINTHDKFRESWNILINHIPFLQRYNSDIGKMERIHKDSNLSESLVMDDASPLFQVMTALQNMHNEFLDDAVIISLCMKCHSTSFLKKSTNTSVLPCINLEDLTEKEVIPNPLDEDLLKFSQCNTNPGCGLQRDYDFYQIEMQVADMCLINKPYLKIQSTFPRVIFSGEILQMSKKVFDEIRENVPQMPLEKDLEKSVLRLKEENPSNLQGLLNYLEMAFRLLTQNPVVQQDDPQNISQLLKQWQSLISVQIPAVTTFCSKVHLCYIIGLYEFVEVLMADYVVDSLEEKYRKPIPDECVDQLNGVARHANIKLLDTVICVLKRFAFRHLSTSYRDASDKLSPCLMDSTLWPTGIVQKVTSGETNMDAGMLSPYLAVEHIVEIIQFFKNALQEKRKKVNSASASFVSQPKEQPSQFLRQKTAQRFRKK